MSILSQNQLIADFSVDCLIKDGVYNETYRIRDSHGTIRFMKLYDPDRMPSEVKKDGKVAEIELCRNLDHPNIVQYITDGIYSVDGKDYPYIVTNYFSGRLLSEMSGADALPAPDLVADILKEIVTGLKYLADSGLVHNDITPRNVMFDPETRRVQLIDMGHLAKAGSPEHHYIETDFSPFFRSPESYSGKNDPAGDIFSAGAVAYALLTGRAPWEKPLPDQPENPSELQRARKMAVHLARKSALAPLGDIVPAWLADTITAALSVRKDQRLTHDGIITAIETRKSPRPEKPAAKQTEETEQKPKESSVGMKRQKSAEGAPQQPMETEVRKGRGFADVAGMDELKELLQKKVLFILKNKEKAERYRLTPPNGMLLYGPPGCGKSYFAEKFAEESGFHYKLIKASDLGSIYVHGGQGKIAELFDKARQKAPIIICFDEFDAMVPNRQSRTAEHISGEVNEFLSQLNNCSKDGIFVIGTTNQPEMIDPAVLRKGRVDISVYIPAPDLETRRLMFDLYLKDRPCDKINTERLAELTDKYVASDIAFIVNDAAMIAAFRDEPITQEGLENSIKTTRPSLTEAMLESYEKTRQKLENRSGAEPRARVGFVQFS